MKKSILGKTPVFAFRCEWRNSAGDLQGFTYAIQKPILLAEINRRQRICRENAGEVKPVPVESELVVLISRQREKFYSTKQDLHEWDLESDAVTA